MVDSSFSEQVAGWDLHTAKFSLYKLVNNLSMSSIPLSDRSISYICRAKVHCRSAKSKVNTLHSPYEKRISSRDLVIVKLWQMCVHQHVQTLSQCAVTCLSWLPVRLIKCFCSQPQLHWLTITRAHMKYIWQIAHNVQGSRPSVALDQCTIRRVVCFPWSAA